MASARKRLCEDDYVQLNCCSFTVLFDMTPKRKKGKFYEVERIITRRRALHVSIHTQQNLNSYSKKKNTCFKQKIA